MIGVICEIRPLLNRMTHRIIRRPLTFIVAPIEPARQHHGVTVVLFQGLPVAYEKVSQFTNSIIIVPRYCHPFWRVIFAGRPFAFITRISSTTVVCRPITLFLLATYYYQAGRRKGLRRPAWVDGIVPYSAALATSTREAKAAASLMASSDRDLRFISTPAFFRPYMKRL